VSTEHEKYLFSERALKTLRTSYQDELTNAPPAKHPALKRRLAKIEEELNRRRRNR
jgi:hypothetical protein